MRGRRSELHPERHALITDETAWSEPNSVLTRTWKVLRLRGRPDVKADAKSKSAYSFIVKTVSLFRRSQNLKARIHSPSHCFRKRLSRLTHRPKKRIHEGRELYLKNSTRKSVKAGKGAIITSPLVSTSGLCSLLLPPQYSDSSVSFRNPNGHRASNIFKMVNFGSLIPASSMMWSSLRVSEIPWVMTVFQK